MLPDFRSELAAERQRELARAADRQRLVAAASDRPSTDSPRRRPRRLVSILLGVLGETPVTRFEAHQR